METTLNLQKGQRVDLTKSNPGLTKINAGAGWDINKGNAADFDLDLSAILLVNGKIPDEKHVIFFNNKTPDGLGVLSQGDNRTGAGDGDDETVEVHLDKLPGDVSEIVLFVNIYEAAEKRQNFGMIDNAFVRLYNAGVPEKTELCKFDLTEDYSTATGALAGRLYKKDNEWKFEAIGTAVKGTINDIIAPYLK